MKMFVLNLRVKPKMLEQIEKIAASVCPEQPNRNDTIRDLIELGLKALAEKETK